MTPGIECFPCLDWYRFQFPDCNYYSKQFSDSNFDYNYHFNYYYLRYLPLHPSTGTAERTARRRASRIRRVFLGPLMPSDLVEVVVFVHYLACG